MRTFLRRRSLFLVVFVFVATGSPSASLVDSGEWIAFVSDGGFPWGNWDIYLRNLGTGATTRLTTDLAIDNHPDLLMDMENQWVVFSSNRGPSGEFDLYLGDVADVEGTLRQLTNDDHPNGPQTSYPDRHPHFHPRGQEGKIGRGKLARTSLL